MFQEAFAALRELPVPVIAAVEGFALGGGCELALCCDLIIASATAVFGLPEVGLGLIPGEGGTQLLPRRIGLNRAADLLLTGRRVGAEEALRIGLADRLVPDRRGPEQRICSLPRRSPPNPRSACVPPSVRSGRASTSTWSAAWRSRAEAWEEAAFSADRVEGIEAFNLRRAPRWPSWREDGPMTEHPHQLPQPVELPVDERESALPLPAQLTRFIITGGFSAIVDFGLLVILMALGPGAHTGQGDLLHSRNDDRVSDQPALDLPSLAIDAPIHRGRGLVRGDVRLAGRPVQRAVHPAHRSGPEPAHGSDHRVRHRPGRRHHRQLHRAAFGDLQAAVSGTLPRVTSSAGPSPWASSAVASLLG